MKYTDSCEIYIEESISIGGFSYLYIFGRHINGGFICLPGWNIACEASALQDNESFNLERLITAGLPKNVASAIAEHINKYIKKEFPNG